MPLPSQTVFAGSELSGFNAIFTFEDALILNTVTNEEAVARLIAARRAAAVCC